VRCTKITSNNIITFLNLQTNTFIIFAYKFLHISSSYLNYITCSKYRREQNKKKKSSIRESFEIPKMPFNITSVKTSSNGVWQGDNPLNFAFPLLIVQTALIIAVSRFLAVLFKPLRQPKVIAEIVVR